MSVEELVERLNKLEKLVNEIVEEKKHQNGTLFSTIKCPKCGEKMETSASKSTGSIYFTCTSGCADTSFWLGVEEISILMNLNPLEHKTTEITRGVRKWNSKSFRSKSQI